MDDNHLRIKRTVAFNHQKAVEAYKAIEALRGECDHPETEIVGYEWAPGHVDLDVKVCAVCGKKIHDFLQDITIQDSDQSI